MQLLTFGATYCLHVQVESEYGGSISIRNIGTHLHIAYYCNLKDHNIKSPLLSSPQMSKFV